MATCCQSPQPCCNDRQSDAVLTVALVGNPNCGKTTLFNALTGARQKVGNWPGVTVERKCGAFTLQQKSIDVVDLPGLYTLTQAAQSGALDEKIANDFILHCQSDVIVNIVDASNLERHLYLTMQLLEMGVPMILALNMMDVAKTRGIHIDTKKLAKTLDCPVVAIEANNGVGVDELKAVITHYRRDAHQKSIFKLPYHSALEDAISEFATTLPAVNLPLAKKTNSNRWLASRLLEGDTTLHQFLPAETITKNNALQTRIQIATEEDSDILIADAKYRFIGDVLKAIYLGEPANTKTWTNRFDSIVLNRLLGIPLFLMMMYGVFFFAINVGGAFQDFFDISSQTIFVDGFAHLLSSIGMPNWLIVILANGIGKGINTTITFIPVIGAMFLFLALLEDSGYMARAAFVIDRAMRLLGLPGKAFVPMIVGFGCNVPAIMGARTLENQRDRILTIMMSPFMSCGARLAIYAVFTAAFFPVGGHNVVFALYLIGIAMAIFTGFLLRATVLKGEPSPLLLELPPYRLPTFKALMIHTWQRLKGFVIRAGRLIVPVCVLIGALNAFNLDGTINTADADTHSLLSLVGQWVTPLFHPMGIQDSNWPATVGLVTGVLAKEVVVGTLNSLYSQMGHLIAATGGDAFSLMAGLKEAWQSIPNNLAELSGAFTNPVLAQAPIQDVEQGVYGLMYKQFDGQAGAFAYLLFILLYFPCISAMGAMLRELNRGWAVFSALWTTGVAYAVAVIFYQAATFARHPMSSSLWIAGMSTAFAATIIGIRVFASRADKKSPPTTTTGEALHAFN